MQVPMAKCPGRAISKLMGPESGRWRTISFTRQATSGVIVRIGIAALIRESELHSL